MASSKTVRVESVLRALLKEWRYHAAQLGTGDSFTEGIGHAIEIVRIVAARPVRKPRAK